MLLLLAARMEGPLPLEEEDDKAGCPGALFLLLAPAESNASSLVRRGDCRDSMFSGMAAPLFLPSDGFLRLAPKNRGMEDAALLDDPSPPVPPPPPPGRCWPWLSPTRRSRAADTFVIELFLILISLCSVAICLGSYPKAVFNQQGRPPHALSWSTCKSDVNAPCHPWRESRPARRISFYFVNPIEGRRFNEFQLKHGRRATNYLLHACPTGIKLNLQHAFSSS
jgi:hypothetical protein